MTVEEIQEAGPPRKYQIIFLFLVGMGVLLLVTTATFVVSLRGQATLSNQEASTELSACRLSVASEYDEARDEILLSLNDPAAIAQGIADLRELYYPQGTGGPKVTRAERSRQLCGTG